MVKWENTRDKVSKSKSKALKRLDNKPSSIVQREDDHGRQSVYDYERKVYYLMKSIRYQITSLEEAQELCNKVMKDPRVVALDPYPDEPYIIQKTWGKVSNARVWERRIRFALPTSNFTVLHELAHILTPGNNHGHQFMDMEARLFGWFIHPEAEVVMHEEIEKIFGKHRKD